MATAAIHPALADLHMVKAELSAALFRFQRSDALSVRPWELVAVLQALRRGGEFIRQGPEKGSPRYNWENEVSEYRDILRQLAGVLPGMQARLLCERARLEHARRQLQAANAWAEASRAGF